MPNAIVPAAGEAILKIESAGIPAEIAVFQRLSQVVTDRAREAIDIAEALVESSK